MARRNPESIKSTRKQTRNAPRLENTRNERETVIIACEDSVSAPLYFKSIFSDLKQNHAIAASSLVIAKHKNTHPTGVLQDLLNHKGYEEFSHQWIVIDRDEERTKGSGHDLEDFNLTIAQAIKKSKWLMPTLVLKFGICCILNLEILRFTGMR